MCMLLPGVLIGEQGGFSLLLTPFSSCLGGTPSGAPAVLSDQAVKTENKNHWVTCN